MSKRKIYTQEFKIEAVKLVTGEGYSLAEAAKSLGITSGMLSRWRTQFEKKVCKHSQARVNNPAQKRSYDSYVRKTGD